jgi:hypothetical protein
METLSDGGWSEADANREMRGLWCGPSSVIFRCLATICIDNAEQVAHGHYLAFWKLGTELRSRLAPDALAMAHAINPAVPGPELSFTELLKTIQVRTGRSRKKIPLYNLRDFDYPDSRDLIHTALLGIFETYRSHTPAQQPIDDSAVMRFVRKMTPLVEGWNPSDAADAKLHSEFQQRQAEIRGAGAAHVAFDEALHSPEEDDSSDGDLAEIDAAAFLESIKKLRDGKIIAFWTAYSNGESQERAAQQAGISERTGRRYLEKLRALAEARKKIRKH